MLVPPTMNAATITALAALATALACSHDRAPSEAPVADASPAPADAAPVAAPVAADEPSPAAAALADGRVTREEFDAVSAELHESLGRLASLQILEVGQLLAEQPSGAMNCYGPCDEDPATQAWMLEHARQVDRLHELVDTAERVAAASPPSATWDEAQAAVRELADLKIIEIESIHRESPSCELGQCPGDPARAATLVALANAARPR